MSSKKNILEVVSSVKTYEYGWPSDNLVEFIAWVNENLELVPKKFRDKAKINIEYRNGMYTDDYLLIEIYYYRPETQEEEINRIKKEQENTELQKLKELKLLAELKAKFESVNID